MRDDTACDTTFSSDEVRDALRRARQVDPTCQEASIYEYVREIREADAILDTIDLGDATLAVSFIATWPESAEIEAEIGAEK